jgi:hypothetical protein
LSCGHKFKPGEQFKEAAVTEKHFQDGYVKPLASSEMEAVERYRCHHCGRIACAKKYCPSCGTPYKESDLYYEDLKPPKTGCLGVMLVLIATCGFLLAIA